jgi:hypothetical protein
LVIICAEALVKTLIENEMIIAGRTLLVSATVHSTVDDRGEVIITEITGITVNGMLPGPRLARKVEDMLADDDAIYEELYMTQPTADQIMLELAEARHDTEMLEQEMFGGCGKTIES